MAHEGWEGMNIQVNVSMDEMELNFLGESLKKNA